MEGIDTNVGDTVPEAPGKARRQWWCAAGLGAAFLALYCLTMPVNRGEAENAYAYALAVEQAPAAALLHPHHLLYLPAMRPLYQAARWVLPALRAFPVLVAVSLVAGAAATAVFFLLLTRRLRYSSDFGFIGASLLGLSYGAWRYAAEAEAFAPTLLFVILTLYLLTQARLDSGRALVAGLLGAVAILLHAVAVLPVLVAFPLVLRRRPVRLALAYYAGALGVSAAVYALCPGGLARCVLLSPLTELPAFRWQHIPLAASGFLQTIVCQNYLTAIPALAHVFRGALPHAMIEDDIFLGHWAGWHSAAIPLCTFLGLIALAVVTVRLARRAPPVLHNADDDPSTELRRQRRLIHAVALLWLAVHSVLAVWVSPRNPQVWITALPALWLSLEIGLTARLWARLPALVAAAVPLLLLHNYLGGLVLLAEPAGDYQAVKAAWLIEHARPTDTIITAEAPGFVRYLRYHTEADIVDLYRREVTTRPLRVSGRVYVMPEVLDPIPALRRLYPGKQESIDRIAQRLYPRLRPVARTPFGTIYIVGSRTPTLYDR